MCYGDRLLALSVVKNVYTMSDCRCSSLNMLLDCCCEFSESESSGDECEPAQDELAEIEAPSCLC